MKRIGAVTVVLLVAGCAAFTPRLLERSEETVTVGTYRLETMIDRPPEAVFDYLADWPTMLGTIDYADFEVPTHGRMRGIGDYADGVVHLLGLDLPIRYVVVRFEPGKALTLATAKGSRGWMSLDMEPVDGKTRLKVNLHLFVLPDSLQGALNRAIMNNERLMAYMVSRTMTEQFLRLKARLENRDVESLSLDHEEYKVFVDAYFMVEEQFPQKPAELFKRMSEAKGINEIFQDRVVFEPAEGKAGPIEAGDVFRIRAPLEGGRELCFDGIAAQKVKDQALRIVIISPDVTMEWDLLTYPSGAGSKAVVLMIVNYSESMSEDTFDTLSLTGEADQWAREGLAEMKRGLGGR